MMEIFRNFLQGSFCTLFWMKISIHSNRIPYFSYVMCQTFFDAYSDIFFQSYWIQEYLIPIMCFFLFLFFKNLPRHQELMENVLWDVFENSYGIQSY